MPGCFQHLLRPVTRVFASNGDISVARVEPRSFRFWPLAKVYTGHLPALHYYRVRMENDPGPTVIKYKAVHIWYTKPTRCCGFLQAQALKSTKETKFQRRCNKTRQRMHARQRMPTRQHVSVMPLHKRRSQAGEDTREPGRMPQGTTYALS